MAEAVIAKYKPERVISGMALGWDMAAAQAAINTVTPFVAAIPFLGQDSKWPTSSQERYAKILSLAAEKVVIGFQADYLKAMQDRNIWMVDQCDLLIALWNGTPGGTANCIRYAQFKEFPPKFHNVWSSWVKYK